VYFRAARHPVAWNTFRFFGPTDARFDHHPRPQRVHPDRGIMYLARQPRTAIAEVFQRRRTVNAGRGAPWLVGFEVVRELRVLDLTGLWPTRAGASMNITSGPHARSRPWARAAYEAYPTIDGLWYGSSMDSNLPCAALFERATDAVPPAPAFNRALADPTLRAFLERSAAQLNYRLIP
jgi:hypothetical protein